MMTAWRRGPFFRAALVAASLLGILLLSAMAGDSALVIPVMLVCTLVLGGVGYGATKQKADAAHARLDRLEVTVGERFAVQGHKLDDILTAVSDLRVLLAARAHTQRSGDLK